MTEPEEEPVRLLRTHEEVLVALMCAREEFLAQIQRNGLTVTPDADLRWWPIARYLRETA